MRAGKRARSSGEARVRELFLFGEVPDVDGVHDKEQQSRNQRNPDQEPRNVNRNILSPVDLWPTL